MLLLLLKCPLLLSFPCLSATQIDEGWSVFCTKGSAKRAVLQVTTIQRTPVSHALDTVRFAWTPDTAKNVSEDITLPKMYVRNIVAEKVSILQ